VEGVGIDYSLYNISSSDAKILRSSGGAALWVNFAGSGHLGMVASFRDGSSVLEGEGARFSEIQKKKKGL